RKEISGNVFVAVLAVKQKSQADICQAHYINNEETARKGKAGGYVKRLTKPIYKQVLVPVP
ncbi:hypothetical protein A2U01_0013548, partial [Trifolium medium]|nr:hypothetical protein [Trifolium medium]